MRRPSRLVASAATVGLLAAPLAGCGSGGDGAGAGRGAASSVRAVGAANVTPEAFLARVEAGLRDAGSAHLQLTATGAMSAKATGDVSFDAAGVRLRATLSTPVLGTEPATVIAVDGTSYLSVPGFTPPGKFVRMDRGAPGADPGAEPAPAALFSALRAAVVRVDDLGAEQVGATSTEHYRVHLAPGKVLDRLRPRIGHGSGPGPMPGIHSGSPSMGGPRMMWPGMTGMMGSLPRTLVADVFLDDQGRVREVRAELHGTEVRLDLTAWGEHVDVQPPGPRDVVPAPLDR